ncbi:hypothetical protein [Micromonospora palomenae]|uniref:hypothetical protein n=1 Tax=Micromonospora palomenae TaxID=1461247 RepID=UPI0012B954FC|nr:hypothetical protein [Micromonospora palomenae]
MQEGRECGERIRLRDPSHRVQRAGSTDGASAAEPGPALRRVDRDGCGPTAGWVRFEVGEHLVDGACDVGEGGDLGEVTGLHPDGMGELTAPAVTEVAARV